MERMLAGLSTRHSGWVEAGQDADRVDRRRLALDGVVPIRSGDRDRPVELLAADLTMLDLVAVHFGEHTGVVAHGFGIDGTECPLLLVEDSTENATLITDLVVGLREGAWT